MPSLEALLDLTQLTQPEFGKHHWTDLTSDLQEHIALPKVWQEHKVSSESGTEIQFNIMEKLTGSARNTKPYDVDQTAAANVMKEGRVNWSMLTTNFIFDINERDFNRGSAQLLDLLKVKRADMDLDFAKLMEEQFWSKPDSPDDDNKTFGIFYWLNWNNPTTGGFTSGDPSGFPAGAAGIKSSTIARWQNWENIYTKISKVDLIRKMRQAVYKTGFKPPKDLPQYSTGRSPGIYTTYDVLAEFEETLESQNDRLGNDLASKDGQTLFRKIPVEAVPYLDVNFATQSPIIGINWRDFKPTFKKGKFMTEAKPIPLANSHTVIVTHMDSTLQYVMRNRRLHWLIQKAA